MASTKAIPDERLPSPAQMNRSNVLDLFLKVANLCEPDHRYDIDYPLTSSQIEYSWTNKYYAKCGPQSNGVYFAINMDWTEKQSSERLLSVIVHEICHFEYGITSNKPNHPPAFWEHMAECSNTVESEWNVVSQWFKDPIHVHHFIECVVNDPNSSVVDGRIETVNERKEEMARLLGRPTTLIL